MKTSWHRAVLLTVVLLFASTAQAQDAPALKAKHDSLREKLASNAFQRPLLLESTQNSGDLQGEVYAVVDQPFGVVGPAFARAMREKVRAAHRVKAGSFDIKHSPGGMIDVEFAVQALVLGHGAERPELIDDVGNIALLQRAEAAGLLPAGVGSAAAGPEDTDGSSAISTRSQ